MTDLTKAREALIEFFRNEGASLGFNGDVEGWTPEQTAIDAMRELIRIKLALDLPQSAEEVELTGDKEPMVKAGMLIRLTHTNAEGY